MRHWDDSERGEGESAISKTNVENVGLFGFEERFESRGGSRLVARAPCVRFVEGTSFADCERAKEGLRVGCLSGRQLDTRCHADGGAGAQTYNISIFPIVVHKRACN